MNAKVGITMRMEVLFAIHDCLERASAALDNWVVDKTMHLVLQLTGSSGKEKGWTNAFLRGLSSYEQHRRRPKKAIPRIHDALKDIRQAKIFSMLDPKSGYW